ncbi:MAG: hypothetical protein ABIG28_02655 [archaeon]
MENECKCEEECACNDSCIFPKCPECGKGYLLPFSRGEDTFEWWRCSVCKHTIEKR